MRIKTLLRNLVALTLSMILTSTVFAQDATSSKKTEWIGKRSGLPLYPKPRKPLCKMCAYVTKLYNEAYADLSYEEEMLEASDSLMETKDQILNKLEAKIADLKAQFIKKPSQDLANQIATEEKNQKQLAKEYGKAEQQLSKDERQYNKALKDYEAAKKTLDDCEKEFCNKKVSMSDQKTEQQVAQHVPAITGEVGVLLGNQNNNRSGNISTLSENFSGSNSKNNFQTGLQARLFFMQQQYIRTFFLVNALTTFNAANTFLNVKTDSFSSRNSYLRWRSLWVAHMIIGLQTLMLSNFFNISAGVGGAVINQELQSSISEDVITTNNTSKTSLTPSGLLSLDFKLCNSCFGGHDLTLSGQFTADRYPSVNSTVKTPLGNTYNNNSDSQWNFAEALVLSMKF